MITGGRYAALCLTLALAMVRAEAAAPIGERAGIQGPRVAGQSRTTAGQQQPYKIPTKTRRMLPPVPECRNRQPCPAIPWTRDSLPLPRARAASSPPGRSQRDGKNACPAQQPPRQLRPCACAPRAVLDKPGLLAHSGLLAGCAVRNKRQYRRQGRIFPDEARKQRSPWRPTADRRAWRRSRPGASDAIA